MYDSRPPKAMGTRLSWQIWICFYVDVNLTMSVMNVELCKSGKKNSIVLRLDPLI